MKVNSNYWYWLVSLIAIGASLRCEAQGTWQVGVRFSPQAPTFRYETGFPLQDFLKDAPSYFRVRTAQGIGFLYQPHDRFSIGADILYSLQGGGYASRKTNLNYVKLPIWIGYAASSARKLVFNLQTGVDVAYLTKATLHYSDGETVDIARYVNRTNWGASVAIGLKFRVYQLYWLNTQVMLHTDVKSLSRTNPAFGVHNYILPGIRISLDRARRP